MQKFIATQANQYLALALSGVLALSACSSETNSPDSSGNTGRSAGIINGYHLVGATQFDEFDLVLTTRTLDYDLVRNQITTTFINDVDNGVVNSTYREFYDDDGRLIRRESPEDNQLRESIYTFDAMGLITTITISGTRNELVELEYDASGNLIEVIETDLDASDQPDYLPRTRTFTYNDNGNLVSSLVDESYIDVITNQLVTSTRTSIITNNEEGQIVRSETTGTDFPITDTMIYSYDENGNMIERITDSGDFYTRTVYVYEVNEEPIFNFWLRRFRFFP